MERSNLKSNDADSPQHSSQLAKPDNRWTILFIGNHGKTITLKRFKGMVLAAFLVLCVSIAITVGLLLINLKMHREKNQLESNLKNLEQQIEDLRYEKDVIMTRLVVAESRSKKDPPATPPKRKVPVNTNKNKRAADEVDKLPAPPAKTQGTLTVKKLAEPTAAITPSEPALSVAIANFSVSPKVDLNLLKVQFKIKNTSSHSQRVSGHAIVVLKGDQLQQNKWLTIPTIALFNGKPTGSQRGYAFGIKNYKTMSFKAPFPQTPEAYQTATVYVFTQKGELLLERDFPVILPKVPRTIAAKPSEGSRSASSGRPASASPPAIPSAPPSTDELMNAPKNTPSQ